MLKIRRPLGRLIFNMGIAIPGKTVFLIETAPDHPNRSIPTIFNSSPEIQWITPSISQHHRISLTPKNVLYRYSRPINRRPGKRRNCTPLWRHCAVWRQRSRCMDCELDVGWAGKTVGLGAAVETIVHRQRHANILGYGCPATEKQQCYG